MLSNFRSEQLKNSYKSKVSGRRTLKNRFGTSCSSFWQSLIKNGRDYDGFMMTNAIWFNRGYNFWFFRILILIRFSSKTHQNRRIRGLGPLKNSSARSGDHFGPVKTKFRQILAQIWSTFYPMFVHNGSIMGYFSVILR